MYGGIPKKMTGTVPFLSVLAVGWKFAANAYANDHPRYRRKHQWKIILHASLHPRFAGKWFNLLMSSALDEIVAHRPHLYIKPFRTYISTRWNKKQKVKIILDTYRFIRRDRALFERMLVRSEDVVVATLSFTNACECSFVLGYDYRFRKEGEMVLTLECAQLGGKISAVAFAMEESENGKWTCVVGCCQGYKTLNLTNDAYKAAQKLFHGMRPNAILVYALQELCRHWGCTTISCVGNAIQADRGKHAVHLPWKRRITFDYDKFWSELGAKPDGDWFALPTVPERKNLDNVPSHKRSMYHKRFKMLDELSLKISESMVAAR